MWNGQKWSYSTTFSSPAMGLGGHGRGTPSTTLLVFEGIKMGASVVLNGVVLGNATDQFVRYSFPVPPPLLRTATQGENRLEVVFDRTIGTNGRFMAASGGWDWA